MRQCVSIGDIADHLSKARLELGLRLRDSFQRVNDLDCRRTSGRRSSLIVHADDKLTAFLELERAVCIHLLKPTMLTIAAKAESI